MSMFQHFHRRIGISIAVAAVLSCVCLESQAQVFGPGDTVLAIDAGFNTRYPSAEGPTNLVDQTLGTKYLNFGKDQTGFIVTPTASSIIHSFVLTTANDHSERDPSSYELYGTNDPITSEDNSLGDAENWIEISTGTLELPEDRGVVAPAVTFSNSASYTSYKMIFPTIKDNLTADSMQVDEAQFFLGTNGTGTAVLSPGIPVIAVTSDALTSMSNYPTGEPPANVIDGTFNKYLNFGQVDTGFIVQRADMQGVTVTSFTITTANDAAERDPAEYELYGTNETIVSPDNSKGDQEAWTLIQAGDLLGVLPEDRNKESNPVAVSNTESYTAYKVVFTMLLDESIANSMQIGEMTFDGNVGGVILGDVNGDGIVSLLDVAPFVDLLTSGGFQAEADINMDGVVSLLDVSPFVQLLTGG